MEKQINEVLEMKQNDVIDGTLGDDVSRNLERMKKIKNKGSDIVVVAILLI